MGVKFRNHHPLLDFVVDFYCHSARVVFEIDGISHDMGDQPEFDAIRNRTLADQNLQIVRITATEVLRDPDAVAESMVRFCLGEQPVSGAIH